MVLTSVVHMKTADSEVQTLLSHLHTADQSLRKVGMLSEEFRNCNPTSSLFSLLKQTEAFSVSIGPSSLVSGRSGTKEGSTESCLESSSGGSSNVSLGVSLRLQRVL